MQSHRAEVRGWVDRRHWSTNCCLYGVSIEPQPCNNSTEKIKLAVNPKGVRDEYMLGYLTKELNLTWF